MAQGFSKAFARIGQLALARGAAPLSKYVGCWETDVDDDWHIALNGHATPTKSIKGDEVPPFHALVERGGLPVGLLSPRDGRMFAGTEDELIAALEGALQGGSDGR